MRAFSLALLALILTLPAGTARSASSAVDRTDHTEVRLVSATDAVGDAQTIRLGLHFKLIPGWKVYWRAPGDAGYPPKPDWKGSKNLKSMAMDWPTPHRFAVSGLQTLGYKDEVLYPLTATVKQPGQPLKIRASVDYLACDEICVPYRTTLSLDLPPGKATVADDAHLINRYVAQVPGDGDGAAKAVGFAVTVAETLQRNGKDVLRVTATSTAAFANPDLYVEGNIELRFGAPMARYSGDRKTAVFEVPVSGVKYLAKKTLNDEPVVLTVLDGNRAAEFKRALSSATGPAAVAETAGPALFSILGFALLGGLILNLMPCVLPVLSLKLLSVVKHGDSTPRVVRASFLASAAGIIAAFLVLAGVLAGMKGAGALIGWGIQFQHPWFLIAMSAVVSLFAFNLWGLFEVRLPMAVSDLGEHSAHIHGLGGHFLSGVFATLLATPCSAPFLGTAVGFALARGTGDIFAVFGALGVGLALPYLGVAAWPRLARVMPKPGAWMVTLKKILGLALALTALWLLSVLATSVGNIGAATVGGLMALGGFALWLGHRRDTRVWPAFAALSVAALFVPSFFSAPPQNDSAALKGVWTAFNHAAIADLVRDQKTVFVDVTADWCITCQVNKAAALNGGEVAALLKSDTVVAMKADWTRPNDSIAAYLASYGRYGIPFNAVYGPGAPGGIVLPELLTPTLVLDALSKASQPAP